MESRSWDCLTEVLDGNEWVKGAVNYDEDLHFSTFYLRASCAHATAPLYPGYTAVVAFYSDFNECYYLLKRECLATATAIVRKALRRPAWLPNVLRAIQRRSDALGRIFPPGLTAEWLARSSDAQVLALYQRHAVRQRSLYRVARLPEALDRGVSYFSTYLQSYLRGLGLSAAATEETFTAFSRPVVPSVLAEELLAFDAIVQSVRAERTVVDMAARCPSKVQLFLTPEVLRRLDAHRQEWQFLSYHGYGNRERTTPRQYIDRLVRQLGAAPSHTVDLLQRCAAARAERHRLLAQLPIDDRHRPLFESYAEIGAVKLHRRSAQLRNFYGLDLLVAEVARRLGVVEWTVRCMLPEEVEASLQAGRLVAAGLEERLAGCVFALLGSDEHLLTGPAAEELAARFKAKTRDPVAGNRLTGVVACRGKAVGPCKVVIRADDVGDFPAGAILVSESTDPDLLGLLAKAGAVLTEQGGVTSHAAVICRELGVPTIIGIDGLLDRVRDGDVLDVDADHGIVTLPTVQAPAHGEQEAPLAAAVIGAKAYNLGVIRALGFRTPEFVVLEYETVRRFAEAPANGERRLVERAVARLGLAATETAAIRSSSTQEDRANGSLAGAFHSLLHVAPERIGPALHEFVAVNRVSKTGEPYHGGVIVQRMVAAEFAGVCLTCDDRAGHGDALILEMTAGGNEAITAGTLVPDRFVVDRLTGDLLEAERRCPELRQVALDISGLVRQFLTLEAKFGQPLDIEWAVAGGTLYILQARPIADRVAPRPARTRPT